MTDAEMDASLSAAGLLTEAVLKLLHGGGYEEGHP